MSEQERGNLPSSKTRKGAGQGAPDRDIIRDRDLIETATDLQARRLILRFGFAYETAVAVSALAFAVAR